MKKEVKEKIIIKPLMECLELLPEKDIEELYKEALDIVKDKKIKSEEDKMELIYGHVIANNLTLILLLNNEEKKQLGEILNENKINNLCKFLAVQKYIFKVDNIYYVSEELKQAFERSNDKEIDKTKINTLVTYYVITNGLLEVNKLIELVKESGYTLARKDLEKLVKQNNYKIKNNVVYLNEIAEDLNDDNDLLEFKNSKEYKIVEFDEAMSILLLIGKESQLEDVRKILKKKLKSKDTLEYLLEVIFSLLMVDCNFQELIDDVLNQYDIELNEDEEKEFYDTLQDIVHDLPSWTLNGYTPHELYCDHDE